MPSFYKAANVFPVPKKGYLSLASKLRPISLLNSESKVFEKTIFKHLKNHFQGNNMGFVVRNLSLGLATKRVSNQVLQLQRLARKLKIHLWQVYI